MKAWAGMVFFPILAIIVGVLMTTGKEHAPRNIEHDGHLFIQSSSSLIHHPACSCQSSLKAIRASK